MPTNAAAWLTAAKTKLEVRPAPYTSPVKNELVIKNGAVAINPVDWMKAGPMFGMIFSWIKLPFVLGADVAGEVVEIGPGVTRFKSGDRVLSFACGTNKEENTSAKSAFQKYTVLKEEVTAPIPSSMSYESACVLPMGVSTAACGLFQKDQLNLQYPTNPPKPTGKTVLIWGGSTSVGSNAIQLAVAAGYFVVATASPKNFDYCKKLGASQVFDYNSTTVVADLTAALQKTEFAGAFSAGVNSAEPCFDIVNKMKTGRFVSMASYPTLEPKPANLKLLRTGSFFASWFIRNTISTKIQGIGWKLIFATTHVYNGVGKAMFEDFLPEALQEGTYVAKPEPFVVGTGLEVVQEGFDVQAKGMSARKVVVSLR